MIGKKNRKRLKKINIDKKVDLLYKVDDLLKNIIRDIHNETEDIYTKMYNANRLDKDKLHLRNDKLKEIKTQLEKTY